MKNIHLFVTTAVVLAACSKAPPPTTSAANASAIPKPSVPAADAPFEGEIVVTVTDEMARKLPSSIAYDIKGNKVAYVPAAAALRAVGDLDAQRVYAINDAERTYDALDLKSPRQGAKPETPPTIYKTGRMEKVAGLDCEDWTVGEGMGKVDVCAAPGIAYMDLAGNARPGRAEPGWAAALTNAKAFPLRALVHDKSGREEYRAEATKAERKTIDEATLAVPAGYKPADLARETKTASLP